MAVTSNQKVTQSVGKQTTCTKRELQSLLRHLLHVHKCVKPARVFLNRMLNLLRENNDKTRIVLNQGFIRGLRWFQDFMPDYKGVSMYNHIHVDYTLELDACLVGLDARWKNLVYHLPIPKKL